LSSSGLGRAFIERDRGAIEAHCSGEDNDDDARRGRRVCSSPSRPSSLFESRRLERSI